MTREEAIKKLRAILTEAVEFEDSVCYVTEEDREPLEMAIKALEQEPKTGHWITQWNAVHQKEYYYCSECREEFSYDGETGIKMNDYDFCPNCGCPMIEPQESEGES